jgi:hypothetical protein
LKSFAIDQANAKKLDEGSISAQNIGRALLKR